MVTLVKDFRKIRTIIFLFQIVILFFISQLPYFIPDIKGIKPNFIMLLAINIALFEKSSLSMALGFICGLFMDIGFAEYFGFYSTTLAVLNLFLSYFANKIKFLNIFKAYIIAFAYILFVLLLSFALLFFANNQDSITFGIFIRYLISLVYTLSFEIIFYYSTKLVFKISRKKQKQMKYLINDKEINSYSTYNFLGSE